MKCKPMSRQVATGWVRAGVISAGLCIATQSFAQSNNSAPPAAPSPAGVTVRTASPNGQLVRVPVNKSVIVEFPNPIREVRLAKAEIAEATAIAPNQIIVTGKSFGATQLIAWNADGTQSIFDLAVDLDLDRLSASLQLAIPRARIRVSSLMDAVVLTGDVPDADAAKRAGEITALFSTRVVNQLKVAGSQQVVLRCTVAEVSRSATRQLGFNGWMGGDNFRDAFALSNLDGINPTNIGAPAGASFSGVATVPFASGLDGIPVTARSTLSLGFPRVQMQVFIRALRENGLAKILAEPNLVAINGQDASFLAGGEVPIPISTNNTIEVQFKQFGVRLTFTPTVLNENTIRLKVAPEISEPDYSQSVTLSGYTIPSFNTRRVETVVELGSGQSFAIGGLLSEKVRAIARKVPALGDVPILGALFSSTDYQSSETELVVLVTPELVEPLSPDQVVNIPGAQYTQPNDFEFYLLSQLDGKSKTDKPALQPRVNQNPQPGQTDAGQSSSMKLRGPVGTDGGAEDGL